MKEKLENYIINEFKKCEGIDLTGDSMAVTRIDEAVASTMDELVIGKSVTIELPFIYADENGVKHLTTYPLDIGWGTGLREC